MAISEYSRRKILVAVDESEESMAALSWAISNLIVPYPHQKPCSNTNGNGHSNGSSDIPPGDHVVVLHVQSSAQILSGLQTSEYPSVDSYFLTKTENDISRRVLDRAKAICDENHLCSEMRVEVGDARETICDAVEKIQPDFLIVGSHGYGAFKRAFLGSVSDYCAKNAKCPVVIVKKKP